MIILNFLDILSTLIVSIASNKLLIQLLFLLSVTLAIIFSWIYIFVISIRSDMRSPSITYKTNVTKEAAFSTQKQRTKTNQLRNGRAIIEQIEKELPQNHAGEGITLEAQCIVVGNNNENNDTKITNGSNNNPSPFVSIIVPARNEQKNIEKCLQSLLSQNYPFFEIIAVNDNSTDDTLKIMRNLEMKIVKEGKDAKSSNKLKVITLSEKPQGWAGKTWASHQGYLNSKGDIILFTDADSHFQSTDVLQLTVSYMQQQELDVLTGLPYLPLKDFWSKIVEPLWNIFIVLGPTIPKINDPQSKQMLVMGSFFMVRKQAYESAGTYKTVKDSLQEDTALGIRIRESGYKLKMAKVDSLVTALLSRDLPTLWHGSIGRSIIHSAIENRLNTFRNVFIMSLMTLLPFLIFAYVGLISLDAIRDLLFAQALYNVPFAQLNIIRENFYSQPFLSILISLSMVSCLMVIGSVAVKCIKKYRQSPLFAFFAPIASVFLIIALLYHIIPMIGSEHRIIQWRGRFYTVKRNGSSQVLSNN